MGGSPTRRPDPAEVWPGRRHGFERTAASSALLAAVRRDPRRVVTCVSAVVNGRRVRWSTRSLSVPCAEVDGGSLRFEGKLLGDGELTSRMNPSDRSSDLPQFSVEADNLQALGIEDEPEAGAFVEPLAGGTVEVAVAHLDVDWSHRLVALHGNLSSARYGPDGESVQFSASTRWRGLERAVVPTVDAIAWPSVVADNVGKPYPLAVGYVYDSRALKVEPIGGSRNYFLVNGAPLGSTLLSARSSSGATLVTTGSIVRRTDGAGRAVEIHDVTSADAEIFVEVSTSANGFLRHASSDSGSIGTLIAWLLVRATALRGEDVDVAGAMEYALMYLHRYGFGVDSEGTARDLLENRVVPQTFGYTSFRGGRYGFRRFPLDGPRATPAAAAHLAFGRELLSGGTLSEGDDSELVNQFSASWRHSALSGEFTNDRARAPSAFDSGTSFWSRVSAAMNREAGAKAVEFPDLWDWRDVRSVLRADERLLGLVLRDAEYLATAEALRVSAGDVVEVTDDRLGFARKPFLVLALGITMRPVVRLQLMEWPRREDVLAVYGSAGLGAL